jgi:hypothetical protein
MVRAGRWWRPTLPPVYLGNRKGDLENAASAENWPC